MIARAYLPWAALVVGGVCALILGATTAPQLSWMNVLDTALGATTLGATVTAALGALAGWQLRRSQALIGALPRAPLTLVRASLEVWLAALIGWASVTVLLVVIAVVRGVAGPVGWWVLPQAAVILLAASGLGVALGYRVPHPLTVVVLPPAVFASAWLAPPWSEMFRPGPVSGSLSGLSFGVPFALTQMALLLGLLGLCVVLASRKLLPVRWFAGSLVGSLALLTVPAVASESAGWGRFTPSGETASECVSVTHSNGQSKVCVAPSETPMLEDLQAKLEPLLEAMVTIGLKPPALVVSRVPYVESPAGSHEIAADSIDSRAGLGPQLFRVAQCAAWSSTESPPPERAFAVEAVLGSLLARESGAEYLPISRAHRNWLTSSSEQDQSAWAKDACAKLVSCDLEGLRLPWRSAS